MPLGPHGAFYSHEPGITSARSLAVMNLSALIRTANKTLSGWRAWVPQILLAAETGFCLKLNGNYRLSPECWDSDLFAINLALYDCSCEFAFRHLITTPMHCIPQGITGIIPEVPAWLCKTPKLQPGVRTLLAEARDEPKMQKHVYNILKPLMIPFDWHALLRVRVVDFVGRHNLSFAKFTIFFEFGFGVLITVWGQLRPFAVSHIYAP